MLELLDKLIKTVIIMNKHLKEDMNIMMTEWKDTENNQKEFQVKKTIISGCGSIV